MGYFDITYDPDDDVLEATFGLYDENMSRTITLNDHILVFADIALRAVWGITFYSYSRLLGVSETEFTGIRDLPDQQIDAILVLLAAAPASHFFDLTDPAGLIARVRAPSIQALVAGES